jgi:hypothetical protein
VRGPPIGRPGLGLLVAGVVVAAVLLSLVGYYAYARCHTGLTPCPGSTGCSSVPDQQCTAASNDLALAAVSSAIVLAILAAGYWTGWTVRGPPYRA